MGVDKMEERKHIVWKKRTKLSRELSIQSQAESNSLPSLLFFVRHSLIMTNPNTLLHVLLFHIFINYLSSILH